MTPSDPSRTAARVAAYRALHQLLDRPRVLDDPLALGILGAEQQARVRQEARRDDDAFARAMRAFVVARSRHAEEQLAVAVQAGVAQYVVLGAGLDTFGCRSPFPRLRVYEIDHPATQAQKRALIAWSGIAVPPSLRFAPVDFERETLAEGLANAGLDTSEPAFFAWLGVTPYLDEPAVLATLRTIATLPSPSGVTFDYLVHHDLLTPAERIAQNALAARVAAASEPFRSAFRPDRLASEMAAMGFVRNEDLGKDELNASYFAGREDGLRVRGRARLMTGWT